MNFNGPRPPGNRRGDILRLQIKSLSIRVNNTNHGGRAERPVPFFISLCGIHQPPILNYNL